MAPAVAQAWITVASRATQAVTDSVNNPHGTSAPAMDTLGQIMPRRGVPLLIMPTDR